MSTGSTSPGAPTSNAPIPDASPQTSLLAIYGTLRRGCENHHVIEGFLAARKMAYIGRERLWGWKMCLSPSGRYPFCVPGKRSVTVEIYSIREGSEEKVFSVLDSFEGMPDLYRREVVETSHGKAWMYVWNSAPGGGGTRVEEIFCGDWSVHNCLPGQRRGTGRPPTKGCCGPLFVFPVETPLGSLHVWAVGDVVVEMSFAKKPSQFPQASRREEKRDTEALWLEKTVKAQIGEYFGGRRKDITFPFHMIGTPFQERVWLAAMRIPYGETKTYTDIAKAIGNPLARRAVAQALKRNPLPLVIPCHRVVASDGIGGFSAGLWRKKALLEMEAAVKGAK